MTKMDKPTPTQIIEALEQSGYLFEQEVADRLESLDFHVDTAWAYLDADLNKSRELDVRAIRRVFHSESLKLAMFVELLVECKAFESPIVFLQRPKNKRELLQAVPQEYVFPVKNYHIPIGPNTARDVAAFIHLRLRDHHYYYREPLKATQFSKVVRKGGDWVANHEGIYDSLVLPLAKALEIQRNALKQRSKTEWKSVWLFFPMVVLRDGLFAIDITSRPLNPEPRHRVSFVRHLESGNVKGFYLLDFVTFDHLEGFIRQEVQPFVDRLLHLCAETPEIFHLASSGPPT